jgi:hypothetical protein
MMEIGMYPMVRPPNTTSWLQPEDQKIFLALKEKYLKEMNNLFLSQGGRTVCVRQAWINFCKSLTVGWDGVSLNTVSESWSIAGVHPWTRAPYYDLVKQEKAAGHSRVFCLSEDAPRFVPPTVTSDLPHYGEAPPTSPDSVLPPAPCKSIRLNSADCQKHGGDFELAKELIRGKIEGHKAYQEQEAEKKAKDNAKVEAFQEMCSTQVPSFMKQYDEALLANPDGLTLKNVGLTKGNLALMIASCTTTKFGKPCISCQTFLVKDYDVLGKVEELWWDAEKRNSVLKGKYPDRQTASLPEQKRSLRYAGAGRRPLLVLVLLFPLSEPITGSVLREHESSFHPEAVNIKISRPFNCNPRV